MTWRGIKNILVGVGLVLGLCSWLVQTTGCSQVSHLRKAQSEQRMLEAIAKRVNALETIEGRGTVRVEYHDERIDVPFGLRLSGHALLEIDAEISSGLFPGLGKISIVSDDNETLVYAGMGIVNLAKSDTMQTALRALLLSLFGGGDLLVFWLRSNGCELARSTTCSGLDLEFTVNREYRSVEKWAIKDRAGRASFDGLVYAWNGGGPLPRIVTGVVHPQEIAVTVEYEEIGLVLKGPSGEPREPAPQGSAPREQAYLGRPCRLPTCEGQPAGNFIHHTTLE